MCNALAEPGAGRLHPGVGQGVGQHAVQLIDAGFVKAGGQQRAGLEGRILRIGQIEQGEFIEVKGRAGLVELTAGIKARGRRLLQEAGSK